MPINEIEFHPYLKIGEGIPASKMIVGTFPIYSVSRPGKQLKYTKRITNNDMLFFYGSKANNLWKWYKKYIDPTITLGNNKSILASLRVNNISISDVITSCSRLNFSFEDKDLRKKKWNKALSSIIEEKCERIICTSKGSSATMGWLNDKILISGGYIYNPVLSNSLSSFILTGIPQSKPVNNPIASVLEKTGKIISIVSLPSPGSPFRKLAEFGYDKNVHDSKTYLNDYLTQVFNWF